MAKTATVILDQAGINRALTRIAHEILESNKGTADLVLVGIRSGGDILAAQLRRRLAEIEGEELPLGAIDVTMYRDDLSSRGSLPVGKTDLPFPLEGRRVILVDDVLYTGRTIRAAMDALIDYGRPRFIRLAVIVDRGWREFPIQADYVGKTLKTKQGENVKVLLKETDNENKVIVRGEP